MLRLIFFVVIGLSYYLGRFKSDWVYSYFNQDTAADPDRLFGVMVTMGVGAVILLSLMLVASLLAGRQARKVGAVE